MQSADPTSPILSDVSLAKTKVSYLTTFGIGQFQKEEVVKKMLQSEAVTIYVDCSTFRQKFERGGDLAKNLDIISRFFSEPTQRVKTHFLDTVFLTDEKATTQLEQIKASLNDCQVGLEKVSQLSIDNPPVNQKLFKDLEKLQEEVSGKKLILDIGGCMLHPTHTAFKKCIKKLKTDLENLMVVLHSFFKQSVVRREMLVDVYIELDEDIKFFLRHVVARWLTMGPAIDRMLKHLPALEKFVLEVV